VSVVVLALLIGFFPALTLYVFGWIKWYEKYSWRLTILITVITIGAMYGIFAMWLRVPFPEGAVVEMLRR
jgi:putative tricarboxylic transport membrane protein